MDNKKNSSENKPKEKPSIWDAKPVTQCATKSEESKNMQNKVIDK